MIVSSTVGSFTLTGWNLRTNAASFSKYFVYSSLVVAPISWKSPLANTGFKILDASIAPSEPPAPMIVWISSINKIIESSCVASVTMRFIRSSNSPRNFVPAITFVRSKDKILLFLRILGILPSAILCARPSTIAVLPTPGSPIRHGLFFVLLQRTCIRRSISLSRPIIGSSFPSMAFSVRSVLYWSSIYSPAPSSISPPSEIASLYSFFALLKSIPAVTKISV